MTKHAQIQEKLSKYRKNKKRKLEKSIKLINQLKTLKIQKIQLFLLQFYRLGFTIYFLKVSELTADLLLGALEKSVLIGL